MKIPKNCPCCHDPLNNFPLSNLNTISYWLRSCSSKLGHKIRIFSTSETNDITFIWLAVNDKIDFSWDFRQKIFYFGSIKGSISYLPYFEPDFSDYPKLIKKLRTYLTFS